MSNKVKLGQRPKNFKRVVKFPMLDGTTGSIEMLFKYRTRKEFGAFIDSIVEDAGVKANASEDEKFSLEKLMAATTDKNAEYIMQVAEGWSLDEELSVANVQQLADEIPAAVNAIMEAYRVAVTEGQVKN